MLPWFIGVLGKKSLYIGVKSESCALKYIKEIFLNFQKKIKIIKVLLCTRSESYKNHLLLLLNCKFILLSATDYFNTKIVFFFLITDKTLAIIFLMLTSFLANIDMSPVSSASVSSHEKHKENYWWHYRSCSSRRIRHAREISVNNVRKQINFTYHSIKKLYNEHKDAVPVSISLFFF